MNRTFVASVLLKARVLADYAVSTGQLPEGSRIFEEMDAVSTALEGKDTPNVAPLLSEMQKISKQADITVEQLMRRKSVLGRISKQMARATPYFVGLVTLLLTLYLAFQSSELHKADLALREYQDLQSERLQEKIYLAWKMYRYERVLHVKAPPLAQLDGYQQLVTDLKRLYEKKDAVQGLLLDSSVIRYVPEVIERYWSRPLSTASVAREDAKGEQLKTPPPLDCSKDPLPEAAAPAIEGREIGPLGSRADLDNHRRSIACFVESLQIAPDYDYPIVAMIYATRDKVNLLVSWLLPGLYGLLGACVFLMRGLLVVDPHVRGPGETRIVDLLSLTLRVALGGLAGIIVGWFWVPTSPTQITAAIHVSSLSFGVAFLAGYSIDSLFVLLDRLINNFRQSEQQKPATGTPN